MKRVYGASLLSGKDSIYSIYLAENYGISIKYLITLITSLGIPSGHLENLQILNRIAENMDKKLFIIDLAEGTDPFIDLLKKLNIDVLVAGDVFVEEHIEWLESICEKANINLMEPLFGGNSLTILKEMLDIGFRAKIICVNTDYLDENWLGFVISKDSMDLFLSKANNIDPLGENGEYHTLVLNCPLYRNAINVKSWRKFRKGKYCYIVCEI
ncbi:MAG: adenine nucleotide alpha hydrolase [Candidatus Methanomethyliaceae archaeon]|nr:adenine nucleotide alpha hydrolase [Candidatus Methanomethyliaceae archaeon]MDW7970304.1 ATP pyrophosphatase [Nitrososphaerota archaeon]